MEIVWQRQNARAWGRGVANAGAEQDGGTKATPPSASGLRRLASEFVHDNQVYRSCYRLNTLLPLN